MKAQITLRSGAQITFDVVEISTRRAADGVLTGLDWTTPPGLAAERLSYVRLSEVVAVVVREAIPCECHPTVTTISADEALPAGGGR